jgi:hypothetical protein
MYAYRWPSKHYLPNKIFHAFRLGLAILDNMNTLGSSILFRGVLSTGMGKLDQTETSLTAKQGSLQLEHSHWRNSTLNSRRCVHYKAERFRSIYPDL